MAKATKAVARARAPRKTSDTLTLNLPITPRLQKAMEAHREYDAAKAAYDEAVAPLWAEWRKPTSKQQNSGKYDFGHTSKTRALQAKYRKADDRLQALCKPMRVELTGEPLPSERILEATLAGLFDLDSRACVVEALTDLAMATTDRSAQ